MHEFHHTADVNFISMICRICLHIRVFKGIVEIIDKLIGGNELVKE